MFILSLQSGSNGNCLYVEAGGARLLVDAGITGRLARARLAEYGRDIRQVDAVVVSHDHADHARWMECSWKAITIQRCWLERHIRLS
jgi:phosphoribosyl 1,2-cyclic phosphodiesterase